MKKSFLALIIALSIGFLAKAQTVITVSVSITSNTTWTNNNIYLLTGGFIYVENNATLTIQPGTLIKGNASALVVTRGAKIIADGTVTQPIVFTSYQPTGFRQSGDWGGLLILGKATINDPAGERLAEGGIDPVKGLYGGNDDNDSSGVLRYVRIEYGGIAFQPNNETNGLTMGGVGRKTLIDYVQVSYCGDDGFEWFGGTVNAKHLIVNKALDDMFDSDWGWRGKVQFFLGISDSLIADISTSNGFESDNDATGSLNAPNTKPVFCNGTIIGPRITSATSYNSLFGSALHLRRSTSTCTYNSVFTGFKKGLKIESANAGANVTSGSLEFKNNVIAGCGVAPFTSNPALDSSGLSFGMLNWFNSNSNSLLSNSTDIMLGNPYNYFNPDFIPKTSSPLLSGASFASANITDPFFTVTTYRGAFGSNDWTKCWSSFNPQANVYGVAPINNQVSTPTVTPSGSTTFCQGNSITLIAPTSASYVWSTGETTQSITSALAGSFSVTVSNAFGCSASSAPVSVVVNALPTATVSAGGPTVFCTGDSVVLSANSAASYLWSNSATTQSVVITSSGNYNVTITDANGCVSGNSNSISVSVSSSPVPTITASGSVSICQGQMLTLCASTSDTYSWSTGETGQCIVVSSAGGYYVTVTNANACSGVGASATSTVVVNAIPVASYTYLATLPSVAFTNTSTGATTYLWDFGDASNSSAPNPAHTFANGTYTVCLTAINAAGCSSLVSCQSIDINTGVDEIENISSLSLYPNPTNSYVTLEFALERNDQVAVFVSDLAGKILFSSSDSYNAGDNSLKIDFSDIISGIYFTRIVSATTSKTIKTVVLK